MNRIEKFIHDHPTESAIIGTAAALYVASILITASLAGNTAAATTRRIIAQNPPRVNIDSAEVAQAIAKHLPPTYFIGTSQVLHGL